MQLGGRPEQRHAGLQALARAARPRAQLVEGRGDVGQVAAHRPAARLRGVRGEGQVEPQAREQLDRLVIAPPLLLEGAHQRQQRFAPRRLRRALGVARGVHPHAVALLGGVGQVEVDGEGPHQPLGVVEREAADQLSPSFECPGVARGRAAAAPGLLGQRAHRFLVLEQRVARERADRLTEREAQLVHLAAQDGEPLVGGPRDRLAHAPFTWHEPRGETSDGL